MEDNHCCWIEKKLGQSAEAKVSAGGSRWFNGEKEVTVQMERSTVVLRSARLELLEIEEAAGDEDLPLLLTRRLVKSNEARCASLVQLPLVLQLLGVETEE
ncbi:hypothetical protein POTOM_005691 [Populus tomentosa]|uniref:Uncharacterized protein n=1 Tax=Populus tomentosa TaxID=118781 RepID=A0A8X8AJS6_POPTO|nr:hypothetical protein POTOM_005691 [Populus tomentosa]